MVVLQYGVLQSRVTEQLCSTAYCKTALLVRFAVRRTAKPSHCSQICSTAYCKAESLSKRASSQICSTAYCKFTYVSGTFQGDGFSEVPGVVGA